MAQILIRDLTVEAVANLKNIAQRHNRSLEAEVRAILEDVAARDSRRTEAIAFADEMAQRSGKQTTDSVELIRKDRDSSDR